MPSTHSGQDDPPVADLIVVSSPGMYPGESFSLRPCKQRLGRGNVDIVLEDPSVSREHAVVWYDDGVYYLQDDVSGTGTILNGRRATGACRLIDGDELLLGDTRLVFRMLTLPRRRLR